MKHSAMHKIILVILLSTILPTQLLAQTRKGMEIAQARRALGSAYASLKRGYYDPEFRGLNIDSLYEVAKDELAQAQTTQQRYRAIQRFMEPLDDSHTGFVVPWRVGLWDYHLGFRFFGDDAIVTKVDIGSHAETAGLRIGDQIVRFAGQELTRVNYARLIANFMASDPIAPLDLTVRGVDGSISTLSVTADTMELRRMRGSDFRRLYAHAQDSSRIARSHVQVSIADSVFVWRLPHFAHVDRGIGDVVERARKHGVLIMDLRGNPGGSVETLTKLLGYFVDEELVVGELRMRTSKETYKAKPKKERIQSRIFLLVDSESASAAEVFARLMQLQGKATVIGDRTAGMVMASQYFPADDEMGAYVTVSDVVLYNGERLEKVGVTPDILAIETPRHVAAGGDPVLSLALLRAGVRMAPAAAVRLLLQAD
ncbi:MAG TPA: S41 family peptidase [Longimicrobiales bacterium]